MFRLCRVTKETVLLLMLSLTANADCLNQPTDLEVGECYEKEGSKNLAQAAYERAIIEDVNSSQARINLAGLYRSMKMKKASVALLKDMDSVQLTPAQRTSLKAIQEKSSIHLNIFKARASLNAGYDSNVNVSPNDAVAVDYNNSESEKSSLFSRLRADLSYMNDLGSAGGWYARSDFNFYYQNNASAHDYDLLYGRIYAGGGYRGQNYTLYIPLFYDRMEYLERDLLQEYGVRPDLTFNVIEKFYININASYTQRRFIQEIDHFRSDDIAGGGLGFFWIDDKFMGYFKTRYENYSAVENPAAAFTDKTRLYAKVGGFYTFHEVADLHLEYQYRYEDYAKFEEIDRSDSNHDLRCSLKHRFSEHFLVSGAYHYTNNLSTYTLAEYVKHEMLLGVEYNY